MLGASSLLVGAAAGYWLRISQRAVAAVMAFGAGVLLALVGFDLLERAYSTAGTVGAGIGFAAGAALFSACNALLVRRGAKNRKRSGCNPCAQQDPNAGLAIALGALLDGVPESFVIGVSSFGGGHQSSVVVAAFFLSNFPEALSSAAGMKRALRPAWQIFGMWGGIVLASAMAATVGHYALAASGPGTAAVALGVAAGAIVAMVVDTMLPEATEQAHETTGIIAAAGFLSAFALSGLFAPA